MQQVIFLVLALLAVASAFAPRSVARMTMKVESSKADAAKFVIPAALIPFVAPMASIAAEGTGRVR